MRDRYRAEAPTPAPPTPPTPAPPTSPTPAPPTPPTPVPSTPAPAPAAPERTPLRRDVLTPRRRSTTPPSLLEQILEKFDDFRLGEVVKYDKRASVERLQEIHTSTKGATRNKLGNLVQENDNCWALAVLNMCYHAGVTQMAPCWQTVIQKLMGKLPRRQVFQLDGCESLWTTYKELTEKHWEADSKNSIHETDGYADCFLAALLSTTGTPVSLPEMRYQTEKDVEYVKRDIASAVQKEHSKENIIRIELLKGAVVKCKNLTQTLKKQDVLIGALARHEKEGRGHFTCFANGRWYDTGDENAAQDWIITHLHLLVAV